MPQPTPTAASVAIWQNGKVSPSSRSPAATPLGLHWRQPRTSSLRASKALARYCCGLSVIASIFADGRRRNGRGGLRSQRFSEDRGKTDQITTTQANSFASRSTYQQE